MTPGEQFDSRPVDRSGYSVTAADAVLDRRGHEGSFELASVAKLFVALTAMIAIEEGSLDLDAPAGRDGSTVLHLLAHASGLAFDSDRRLAAVGARRVYSNTGIETYAAHLEERTGMPYREYLRLGVVEPLELAETMLHGSPAADMRSTVDDVSVLAREFLRPTLVSEETLRMARTPVFAGLSGVLPGIGSFDPNPFGPAMEVKGDKSLHWSGTLTSAETFGHFGGAGTFLWVDPVAGIATVALTDRTFGGWAMRAWPEFSDLVVRTHGSGT